MKAIASSRRKNAVTFLYFQRSGGEVLGEVLAPFKGVFLVLFGAVSYPFKERRYGVMSGFAPIPNQSLDNVNV